jgi:succinyl-CoA synthetase alpha subunit
VGLVTLVETQLVLPSETAVREQHRQFLEYLHPMLVEVVGVILGQTEPQRVQAAALGAVVTALSQQQEMDQMELQILAVVVEAVVLQQLVAAQAALES